ncbi:MAG: AI-2E family transporter [Acidimicrobiales bacterium]|nr:AI-2E family transporter [Acidimicrobiales bacterium]
MPEGDDAGPEDTPSTPDVPDYDRMPRWVPRAIALFFVGIIALATTVWLIGKLRELLVMLLVALFLSFALEPAVNWLQARGWRRGPGTAAVFAMLFVAGGLFVYAIGSLFVDQVQNLVDQAPEYVADVEDWANDTFDADINTDDLTEQIQSGSANDIATGLAGNVLSVGAQAVGVLFRGLTILLFTFYLVADGPRLRRSICSVMRPDRQREVLRVWEIAVDKTGGYIYSRGLLAFLSAVFHYLAFLLIGVPFPLPLAIWVGVLSQFVPVVGTYLAGALPLVIALIDQPIEALWVLIAIVVYQQVENYLLAPPITAHTMDIHPAVAFGAVIAGASILGPVGALLALPAGATLQAFVSTYVNRHDVVETHLTKPPREKKRPFLTILSSLRDTPRNSPHVPGDEAD